MIWLKLVPAWLWVAIAGAALVGLQQLRVADLQGDVLAAQDLERQTGAKLAACRVTRTNLLEQTIEQNQAVANLRQDAADRAAVAQAGQAAARTESEKDYQAANRLQQERAGGDACAAAEAVIDQELGL